VTATHDQVTETQVTEALRPVQDPELRRSIVSLGMVQNITIAGGTVGVTIALTVPGCPLKAEIQRSVSEAVAPLDGVGSVTVEFTVMTDEQREAVRTMVHGDPAATAGTNAAHGHSDGREIPFGKAGSRTRVLLIASGKGGVGKSSITTNLAVALAQRGRDVAVIDADVWGFSIPRMLGTDQPPVVIDEMLVPPEAHGVRCISMGFFADEDQPIIWRGPMLHKALEQFLTDVYWDEPDYLLVDLPPGTGDISISLAGFLPTAEMYIVTTPQPVAQKVALRAAHMAEKVRITVRGVIENMSWFTGDDGTRYELFGSGGGAELAEQIGVRFVGQVPLIPEMREGSDTGNPVAARPDTEAGGVFAEMARVLDEEMQATKRTHPELKLLS
jgi:ATP-binding protein involved in chromosome partitioning|tara:strand:+ start:3053 stop:4210 length:1158 start_codon:yes stop_codon:yes gene_type:complete